MWKYYADKEGWPVGEAIHFTQRTETAKASSEYKVSTSTSFIHVHGMVFREAQSLIELKEIMSVTELVE
jgi:hypothetical protein